jgi:hypothetical protein
MVARYAGRDGDRLEAIAHELIDLAEADGAAYAAFRSDPSKRDAAIEVPSRIALLAREALDASAPAPAWFASDVEIALGALRVACNGGRSLAEGNADA